MADTASFSKTNPFHSSIKERYSLSKPGTRKHTCHITLDLKGSGLTYNVGDSIGIYPRHDPKIVEKTLQALKATGDEVIADKQGNSFNLREFLTHKANISDISRKMISEIAQRQPNLQKKERLEWLLAEGNKDALKAYQESHEVWDCLKENQEVEFTPQELCLLLMPLLPRLYSISSSQKEVGEEVHLTVAYLRYNTNEQERLGVCTHYLCNLAPMQKPIVPVYVQPSHGFTLPEDPSANLIMIGPGTGIAPFRAFMQERMATGAKGQNWLFFGEWNRKFDYFYEEYWNELEAKGILRVDTAFSRDQEHKVYVQHRMLEHAGEIFEWVERGGYIFVCGDAHRMAKDVDAVLHQIVQQQGNRSEQETKEYIKRLRTEKRYLRDVY